MSTRGDFYQDDEPVEDVLAAFNRGAKGITVVPPALRQAPVQRPYYQLTTVSSGASSAAAPREHRDFMRQANVVDAR